jgi:hydroxypyruvate isomerase
MPYLEHEEMNRRQFSMNMTAGILAAAMDTRLSAPHRMQPTGTEPADKNLRFKLSVMLWTVFRDLPFEQRLEKVAEAGYPNVELVGEYAKWSDDDFKRANAKRKELGIRFDATAGLKHGVGNPGDRDAMLGDLREALVSMEKIDCPSIILLSGDVVPRLSREAQHQSCIDGLKAATKLVEGKQIAGEPVRLLLECIDLVENPKYFLPSAAEGFDIVKAVNHAQVQFLYDLFHEQVGEGNLIEKLRKNIEYVGLIHVADVPGRHEPGTGEINYPNIFRTLAELRYDRGVAMEFLPTSDPISKLIAARELALQYGQ